MAVTVRQVEAYTRLAGVYDELVVDPCHGRWASYLDGLWATDAHGVETVLDVCCGTGLLAGELASRGYRVVGVDASEAMLAAARDRLGAEVELRRSVLPHLAVGGTFDAAVCTFDGLNYLPPDDLAPALTAVGRRLRKGGWFVFDLHTDEMMAFTLANPVVSGEAAGAGFVLESTVDRVARTVNTRIEVVTAGGGEGFSEEHRQYFHADDAVRAALASAGFDPPATRDEYSRAPVGPETLRATWLARRPR